MNSFKSIFQPLLCLLAITSGWIFPHADAYFDYGNANSYKCRCGISIKPQERIMGGEDAEKNEFPWHVAIMTAENRMFCGATLLDDRHILTAAHCLAEVPDATTLKVVLGEHYYKIQSSLVYPVESATIHPNYKGEDYINDIAMIRIRGRVMFTPTVHPPCLPRPGYDYTDALATVIGWGQLVEDGGYPEVLQKVQVPIMATDKCIKKYGKESFTPAMICAAWKEGGRDSCVGDSGGPLLLEMNGRWNLIGIVSWGHGCGWANFPAAYTRVDKFLTWIHANSRGGKSCRG